MSSDSDDGGGIETVILTEIALVLEPVGEAGAKAKQGNEEAVKQLLADMGLDEDVLGTKVEPVVRQVEELAESWDTLQTSIVDPASKGNIPDLSNIPDIYKAVKSCFEAISALDEIEISAPDVDQLGERVIDYLLITYLGDNYPIAYGVLALLGVIRPDPDGGTAGDLDLTAIGTVFTDPNKSIQSVFKWGTQDFEPYIVLFYVKAVVTGFGLDPEFEEVAQDIRTNVQELSSGESWPGDGSGGRRDGSIADGPPSDAVDQQLTIDVFSIGGETASGRAGIHVIPVPGKNGHLPGLAVTTFGMGSGEIRENLGDGWTFNAKVSAQADWALRLVPEKGGETVTELIDTAGGSPSGEVHADGKLTYEPPGSTDITPVLGDPSSNGIGVRYFQTHAKIDYDGDEVVFVVEIPSRGHIQVTPKGGFLKTVIPDGIAYDFDTTVGWSSQSGLFFERGGTLEASIPQNRTLGPVKLKEIYTAMQPEVSASASTSTQTGRSGQRRGRSDSDGSTIESDAVDVKEGKIIIEGATSGSVTLGPVTATIKRVGVEGEVAFPGDGEGNLGPADVELGFKPPTGVGIAFNAGPVRGGGYLEFDPENDRYAGVLQLKTSKLTINAVGLLKTELPGKEDGFSLLLLISGQFPPVQLGLGFTLNGVGGLVGINRSMKRKPLGKAVRTGSMDSILFPQNPIANATRIISDLRAIFPPTADTHVVGPIARLGWGTPQVVTMDVGVVLSIPTWKIALLGKMSSVLPDEEVGLIELNLAVVGFLDPPNKRLAVDASLYDSRIAQWSISGDMALRSSWGDNPRFVLSVGGWNPRFEPPSNFPELDRVKASMGTPDGTARIEYTGYFAVTSNTFQMGAGVHLLATPGPIKVEGKLVFDTLIEFSPFKFIVDFLASFSVTVKGKGLSIKIDGTLMGPGPYRVKGTVKIDIVLITIKAKVDATFGPSKSSEELPRARVLPELMTALGKPTNWSTQLPADGPQFVTLRDVDTGDTEVLAHPMGRLGVRQTVVPLDYDIEKYGDATPAGYSRFSIDAVSVDGSGTIALEAKRRESFAPAKYRKMSDSEKLNSKAFEQLPAGREMDHEGVYCGYAAGQQAKNTRTAAYMYECTVIDRPRDNWGTALAKLGQFRTDFLDPTSGLPSRAGDALMAISASGRSPATRRGLARFQLTEAEKQAFDAQAAGLAREIDVAGVADSEAADDAGTGPQRVVRGGEDPDVGGVSGAISMNEPSYTVATAGSLRETEETTGPMTKSEATRELGKRNDEQPQVASHLQVVETRKVTSSRQETAAAGGRDTWREGVR